MLVWDTAFIEYLTVLLDFKQQGMAHSIHLEEPIWALLNLTVHDYTTSTDAI